MRSEWKRSCVRDHVVDARECSGVIYVQNGLLHSRNHLSIYLSRNDDLPLRGQMKQGFYFGGDARRCGQKDGGAAAKKLR